MNLYDVLAGQCTTHFERLFSRRLAGGGKTHTLTGQPPLSFKSDGTPLISWSMKGNGQQQGTPTPDAPIMPDFCGVRTGNLYFKRIAGTNISESGTITTLTGFDLCIAKVERGVQYSGNGYIYAFFETEPTIGSISYNDSRAVNNLINVAAPISGFVAVRVPSTTQNVMCNTGSYVLPYEPYGWKIPLTCAGQTTPVYLGEVPTARRVKKLVLTGEENWDKGTYAFYHVITGNMAYKAVLCTHYQYYDGTSSGAPTDSISTGSGGGMAIWIKTQNHADTTIEQWKSYLAAQYAAGTPVTVWYVLAEPTTGIVNEPLYKIGDYADELHSEDAGVTIPTAKGQNTLTVETDLQPSEMTITYKV